MTTAFGDRELRRVGVRLSTDRWWTDVPLARLELLARDLHRVVVVGAGSTTPVEDELLARVIAEALEAFLADSDRPRHAAASLAPLLGALGAREASAGRAFDELAALFESVRRALEVHVPRLAVDALPPSVALTLRTRLLAFLDALLALARSGYDAALGLELMPADVALDALRRALFDNGGDRRGLTLRSLAAAARVYLGERVTPVVAIDGPLPVAWSRRRDVLLDSTGREALVPPSLAATLASGDLVVAPCVDIEQVPRSLGLARRTRRLATRGRLPSYGPLRCDDVLGALVVGHDPFVVDRLVRVRLAPLLELSARRRADLGRVLLTWLGTGCSVNDLARRLGQHRQTVHSKVRRLRVLFGDDLDDPDRRLELVVALREVMPRWEDLT